MQVALSTQARKSLLRKTQIELARRSFWHYCQYLDSEKYQVPHLQELCTVLNNVYYGLPIDSSGKIYRRIALSYPPRHWKTRTLVHFVSWCLGKDNNNKIIAGSYNEIESGDYGKYVRTEIEEEKNSPDDIIFSDIFPDVLLKQNDRSRNKWALEGKHFSFLATSPGGSLTGKGGNIKILDDLVKNNEEAMNENHLDKLYTWYVSTYASRTEGSDGGIPIEVICATRWSENDPIGRVVKDEPGEWFVLSKPVIDENGDMLCEEMLSREAYERIKVLAERNSNPVSRAIHSANYLQRIVAIEGCLYTGIRTYDELPATCEARKAYVDSADEGSDWVCAIMYIVYMDIAYVVDVYYSQADAPTTEPELASKLKENDIKDGDFESNAGGRAYSRNVKKECAAIGHHISVMAFHQKKNKESRIRSQSNNVLEVVRMPENWIHRWPDFARDVLSFNMKMKGQADDAPDALTGVKERMSIKTSWG